MVTKHSKLPRKKPEQKRSSSLVEAILTATARVVSKMGMDQISTNKVAELAGVSIGSLYQYFPNKEALVGALIEKHTFYHTQLLEEKIKELGDCSFDEVVETLVRTVLDTIVKDRPFLKILVASVFYVERVPTVIEARFKMIALLRDIMLEPRFNLKLDHDTAEMRAYTMIAATGGVVEMILFDDSATPERHEKLIQESIHMVKGYLKL